MRRTKRSSWSCCWRCRIEESILEESQPELSIYNGGDHIIHYPNDPLLLYSRFHLAQLIFRVFDPTSQCIFHFIQLILLELRFQRIDCQLCQCCLVAIKDDGDGDVMRTWYKSRKDDHHDTNLLSDVSSKPNRMAKVARASNAREPSVDIEDLLNSRASNFSCHIAAVWEHKKVSVKARG